MADHVALSTQERNPRSAVIRTVFAFIVVGFPVLNIALAIVVNELQKIAVYVPEWLFTGLNVTILVTAALTAIVTRILAIPGINDVLRRFFPLLAPEDDGKPDEVLVVNVR